MSTRILIAMTSHATLGDTAKPTGVYLPEVAHPFDVFRDAGFQIDFASVRGGEVPLYGGEDDEASQQFLAEHADALNQSQSASRVSPKGYAAIFFAGGHGTMWDFPENPHWSQTARDIYESGGIVAAVCHGPAALVSIQLSDGRVLIEGKHVTGFSNEEERAVELDGVVPFLLEDRLRAVGAKYESVSAWKENVVVSERVVTGQNPASAKAVAEAVVATLRKTQVA